MAAGRISFYFAFDNILICVIITMPTFILHARSYSVHETLIKFKFGHKHHLRNSIILFSLVAVGTAVERKSEIILPRAYIWSFSF